MAAAHEPLLITVDLYREMPHPAGELRELHHGQIVTLTRPKAAHIKLQSKLVRLLRPLAEPLGYVESELPFRALPEYDLRAADVAFVSKARWDAVDDRDDLQGAPEMVIEVLSKSNSQSELCQLASLCLSAGCREFWVVDPEQTTIAVTTAAGTHKYSGADRIPLPQFGQELSVRAVFGEPR